MDATELSALRAGTAAFIAADPLEIALVRKVRVDTASGGYRLTDEPVASQIFRLIPANGPAKDVETPDGRVASLAFTLLGAHDADMARGDTFSIGGLEYQLASPIWPEHSLQPYERKAAVVRHGG